MSSHDYYDRLAAALRNVHTDLMGGGVTCAAIEKEASEKPVSLPEAVMRRLTRERDDARTMAKLWKATAREHIGRADTYKEWMHAAQGNSGTWASIAKQEAERANRAERALADVHERDETVARLETRLTEAEYDRNSWKSTAIKAMAEVERAECHDCIRDAAVIEKTRTLTPEDIGEDMIERGCRAWADSSTFASFEGKIRSVLTAALTEPPRPEGVEDIEALLEGMPADLIGGPLTAHEARTLADHLATHGVRVTTEEGEHTPACEGGPGLPCDTCGSYWPGDAEGER